MSNYLNDTLLVLIVNLFAVGFYLWGMKAMKLATAVNARHSQYLASLVAESTCAMFLGMAIIFTIGLEVSLMRELSFAAAVAIGLLMCVYSSVALKAVKNLLQASFTLKMSYASHKQSASA